MLLSIPPRKSERARLVPGLALRAGDPIAGRNRALSLLRADRACAHFAASQNGSNAKVEVQILLAMDASIEAVQLRFLADARRAAALRGPNVVRILQVGVTPEGQPFVVHEAQRGETLASLLTKAASLSTESAVDIALAVCAALEEAHALGVVHGELEPSSIHLVWTNSGPTHVKVAGLGTSRALAMLPHDGRSFAALAGRAPELRTGDEIDGRADVWGVGVLLYTMLAGVPPFAGSPSTMNVAAALEEPAMLAGVPDALAEIVDACLARDPAQRPKSAAALTSKLGVFGSCPVFEKRTSMLVVDTGPYDAVVLDRLVKEAAPSDTSIDVSFDSSVPDLAAAASGACDLTPTPTVVTPASVPPVALSIAPLAAQLAPSPRTSRTIFFVAAACIGLGVVVGALSMRPSAAADASSTANDALPSQPRAAALPPPAVDLAPAPAARAPAVTEPAVTEPATVAIADLPSATPRRPSARPRVVAPPTPAAPPRAAAPAPAVDPIIENASAPIQPKPKASDDDLRRFLDDRR